MSQLLDSCKAALAEWNKQCERAEKNFRFELRTGIRVKKYHITKTNFIEKEIAELCLFHRKTDEREMDLLLYRKELPCPPKIKGTPEHQREALMNDLLCRHFHYDMIGSFTLMTKQTIVGQDYAEYDIENDRLRQHDSAVGMVIKTLTGGPFFEIGDEFDVFMDIDDSEYYAVYTEHEIGKANNGIARIPKNECLITQTAKKQIILL